MRYAALLALAAWLTNAAPRRSEFAGIWVGDPTEGSGVDRIIRSIVGTGERFTVVQTVRRGDQQTVSRQECVAHRYHWKVAVIECSDRREYWTLSKGGSELRVSPYQPVTASFLVFRRSKMRDLVKVRRSAASFGRGLPRSGAHE